LKRELIGTAGPLVGMRIPIDREEMSVGRDPDCDLFLEEETVSRRHARILLEKGKTTIVDEGSRNGVFIDGKRVIRANVEYGMPVHFGRCCFVYWETGEETFREVSPSQLQETDDMVDKEELDSMEMKTLEECISRHLLGISPAMDKVRREILTMGPTPLSILFVGDTGTGKELAAEACHRVSERREGPLIKVNCAALHESLLESELFGHEKGAFTGANERRAGKFELAHEGSILLDEVGDMSPVTQAKILRVLQDGSFYRVGGSAPIFVRVRVMAATLKDLEEECVEGRFRRDLLYRLNAVTIRLPSLSEHPQDLPILVDHFRDLWEKNTGKRAPRFGEDALTALKISSWPGNIRQLKNVVDRLCALGGEEVAIDLVLDDLPPAETRPTLSFHAAEFHDAKEDFERVYLQEALKSNNGNIKKTAEAIGLDRHNLAKKLKRLGIHPSQ